MASFQITRRNGDTFTVLVDDADLERVLAAGPWSVRIAPHAIYVQRNVRESGKASRDYLHRWLMQPDAKMQIDHRNQDGLDNRRENLRACSSSENLGNRRRARHNRTGLKGVVHLPQRGKYRADIRFAGRRRCLGYFDTAEEAHAAYCRAAKGVFGEFARFG